MCISHTHLALNLFDHGLIVVASFPHYAVVPRVASDQTVHHHPVERIEVRLKSPPESPTKFDDRASKFRKIRIKKMTELTSLLLAIVNNVARPFDRFGVWLRVIRSGRRRRRRR